MEQGPIYFYTATIKDWIPILENMACKRIILDSLAFLVEKKAIKLYGFVIMPNHIHLIIKSLAGAEIKSFQLSFMRFTAQKLKFYLLDNDAEALAKLFVGKRDRDYQIWQRNPLAVELHSREMLEEKLDYIHGNPVQGKWSLTDSAMDYQYSSIRFYEDEEKMEFPFLSHYMEEFE